MHSKAGGTRYYLIPDSLKVRFFLFITIASRPSGVLAFADFLFRTPFVSNEIHVSRSERAVESSWDSAVSLRRADEPGPSMNEIAEQYLTVPQILDAAVKRLYSGGEGQ